MKTRISKTLRISFYSFLAPFVAFVVYANWEPAPLHAYAKPIEMTILKVANMTNAQRITQIKATLEQTEGVTAFAANGESQLVSITFDPQLTSASLLTTQIKALTQSAVEKATFGDTEPNLPQCPVPHSYILAFEKAKYALCFR